MARLPLEDVKILDFMWVMAGPAGTRMLADYGAVIVRIESPTRIDTARTLSPYQNNQIGPDASGLFSNCNAGKFGLTLDIGNPRSREIIRDLVKWADVVTESFSPKAMRAWGLDYQAIRKIKPDIIMLSSCLMGQTGPLASFAGFGNLAAAISGFHNLTGWPDRAPGRAVRRVHRLCFAALHRDRDSGRARISAPHRQGPVHRPVAGAKRRCIS